MEEKDLRDLSYPQLRADLELCDQQLFEICKGERNKAVMSVPVCKTDFDMQFSAAFKELEAYRTTGLEPAELYQQSATISLQKLELETKDKQLAELTHERTVLKRALEMTVPQLDVVFQVRCATIYKKSPVEYFTQQAEAEIAKEQEEV